MNNIIKFPKEVIIELKKGDRYYWTDHNYGDLKEVIMKQGETLYTSYMQAILRPGIKIQSRKIISEFSRRCVEEKIDKERGWKKL